MRFRALPLLAAAILLCLAHPVLASEGPRHRAESGAKWRIAYYQGGEYKDYHQMLVAVVESLMMLGWLEESEIPKFRGDNNAEIWRWLAQGRRSEYLEFLADGFYSAGWDDQRRETTRRSLITRLGSADDVDLVIAMGTWSGKDLANDLHETPVMVVSSSDAISAGIVRGPLDSGFDHVHAHVDPLRYGRQVDFFHGVVGFERLGVAYEDTVEGRSYSGIELLETVASRRGFEVVRCHTRSDVPELALANQSVIDCMDALIRDSDAIYITAQGGVNDETIPQIVRMTRVHKVPTFSQLGTDEVRQGVLLSMGQGDFSELGRFHARAMARVFHGEEPGDLEQVFVEQPRVALNVTTAAEIGFYPSAEILAGTDELFGEIELIPNY